MNTLVTLQKVDGRFVLSSELLRVVGRGSHITPSKDQLLQILTYPHPGTLTFSSLTSSELEDVWSTLLVIFHFETRLLEFSEVGIDCQQVKEVG
jgi:hypothetical protein